ncbi:MAG: hypothetical protein QXP54_06880 [Thermofilum sp.]
MARLGGGLLGDALVVSVVAVLAVPALALVFLLFLPDPVLASRVLSFAVAFAALFAGAASFRVMALRGVTMDPLAGIALFLASPGFFLAFLGWLLRALGVELAAGPLPLSKLLWYSAGLVIALALYELGRAARLLAGLKAWEAAVAVAVPAAFSAPLCFLLVWAGAPQARVAETLASAVLAALSLLAFLPVYRGRLSRGLGLATAGAAVFAAAIPLGYLVGGVPAVTALYALSFLAAAAGIIIYGEEKPLVR